MKVWFPIIHFHIKGEEGCHKLPFNPHLELDSVVKFWEERKIGIETMANVFDIASFDLAAGSGACEHENVTEDCEVCEMWMTATLVDQVISSKGEIENNGSAHSA